MDLEVRLPQLDTLIARIDELLKVLQAVDAVAAATPEPVQPEPAKRAAKRGHTQKAPLMPKQMAADAKDEDHDVEDEDTLRARVDFEAKRTTRQFGIGATRAAIKRIAGDGVLRVDEVPAVQLPALLTELQAL